MTNIPEDMRTFQQNSLETAAKVTQISFENSRRIVELQTTLARSLFEEGIANMQELAKTSDPAQAIQLRARFTQASAERMLAAARELTELTTRFQSEIASAFSVPGLSAEVPQIFQNMIKGFPAIPADPFGAMQKAFETARETYEQITRNALKAFSVAGTPADKPAQAE